MDARGFSVASGLLFLMRGLLVQAGRERLAMHPALRYLSYLIDTVLQKHRDKNIGTRRI